MKTLPLITFLLIPILFLALLPTISFAGKPENFQGHWSASGKDWVFTMELVQKDNKLTGSYCAVAYGGNRMDCGDTGEDNIKGVIQGNVANITFASFYGAGIGGRNKNIGKAKLTMSKDRIEWVITEDPKNKFYYCPDKAILKREEVANKKKVRR